MPCWYSARVLGIWMRSFAASGPAGTHAASTMPKRRMAIRIPSASSAGVLTMCAMPHLHLLCRLPPLGVQQREIAMPLLLKGTARMVQGCEGAVPGVVVLAAVRDEHRGKRRRGALYEQRRRLFVGEVSQRRRDALLELQGIGALPEHVDAVVGLEHRAVQLRERVLHRGVRVAEVGEDAQRMLLVPHHEVQRLS